MFEFNTREFVGPVVGGVLTDVVDYRAAASVSETSTECMYILHKSS